MGLAAVVGVCRKSTRKHTGYWQTAKFEQGLRHLVEGGTKKFISLGSVCLYKTHVWMYNSH